MQRPSPSITAPSSTSSVPSVVRLNIHSETRSSRPCVQLLTAVLYPINLEVEVQIPALRSRPCCVIM